jgi:hypothetical protein
MGKTFALRVGDMATFLIFVIIGNLMHHFPITFMGMMETSIPFLAAWFAAGTFVGAFKPESHWAVFAAFRKVTISWIIAAPLAFFLRSFLFQKENVLPFMIVTIVTVYLFLLLWRISYTLVINRLFR